MCLSSRICACSLLFMLAGLLPAVSARAQVVRIVPDAARGEYRIEQLSGPRAAPFQARVGPDENGDGFADLVVAPARLRKGAPVRYVVPGGPAGFPEVVDLGRLADQAIRSGALASSPAGKVGGGPKRHPRERTEGVRATHAAGKAAGPAPAGAPYLVKDIDPVTPDAGVDNVTTLKGKVYFTAYVNEERDLWSYDPATDAVARTTTGSLNPYGLVTLGDTLYFAAVDPDVGNELFRYDGANPPEVVVDALPHLNHSGYHGGAIGYRGKLYFQAQTSSVPPYDIKIIAYDPTTEDTTELATSEYGFGALAAIGDTLYFNGSPDADGAELMALSLSDPEDVPALAADLNPNPGGSDPRNLTALAGKLYFSTQAEGVHELWVYDPATGSATWLLTGASQLSYFLAWEPAEQGQTPILFFEYRGPGGDYEIWQYDGATAGPVPGVQNDGADDEHYLEAVIDGSLYFQRWDIPTDLGDGFRKDLTTGTVEPVTTGGVSAYDFAALNGTVYFSGWDAVHGQELWSYDGTTASLAADVLNESGNGWPWLLTEHAGKLYFQAGYGDEWDLWVYDPATDTHERLTTGSENPEDLLSFGGLLYYIRYAGSEGDDVVAFDGVSFSTITEAHFGDLASINEIAEHEGKIYISGVADGGTRTLFEYDPETGDLTQLYNDNLNAEDLTSFGGDLYFRGLDGDDEFELLRYDGTSVAPVADLNPQGSSYPSAFTVVGDLLYFFGSDADGMKLWSYDGANPPVATASPVDDVYAIAAHEGVLYFNGPEPTYGTELWTYEGGAFTRLTDINPVGDASPGALTFVGDVLYFEAKDENGLWDLWTYDTDTEALVRHTHSGFDPYDFEVIGNTLFMPGEDPVVGGELFALDLSDAEVTFTGEAGLDNDRGWRMLSAPVSGATRADLEDDLDFSTTSGNLLHTWSGSGWQASTSSTALQSGRGFILFLFDDPDAPVDPTLSLGLPWSEPAAPVTVSGLGVSDRWHLLGNPYDDSFDLSALGLPGSGFQATVQIWNPQTSSYGLVMEEADASDVLAPWQGFFAERSVLEEGATSLTFDLSGDTEGGVLVGKTGRQPTAGIGLRLIARDAAGREVARDEAARLLFREEATDAWDAYDAGKLKPLPAERSVSLSFAGTRNGEAVDKAQESRPMPTGSSEVTLAVDAKGIEGPLELSWPALTNVPEAWELHLLDTATGTRVDLRQASSYSFAHQPSAGRDRFRMEVTAGTATGAESETPAVYGFEGAYPNPFRGAATLAFALPEAGEVRLSVYDVLGRRVAVAADGAYGAGVHRVRLEAGALTSGTYLLRLETKGGTFTRTVTVVR